MVNLDQIHNEQASFLTQVARVRIDGCLQLNLLSAIIIICARGYYGCY